MKMKINNGTVGSSKLISNYKLSDFYKGYKPHIFCLVGAMCSECKNNLKKDKLK